MTVEEMINFSTNNCVTLMQQEIETKIINGVYTVSRKSGLDFNEEEIKKMLLMFKPMQKELEVYKNAFEKSCWLLSMSSECFNGYCPLDKTISDKRYGVECKRCPDCNNENVWQEYFMQKARGSHDN